MHRPLSPAQLRVWQAGRERPGFSMAVRLDLDGPLDAGALCAAIGRAVREDEALRLRFRESAAGPVQEFGPEVDYAPEFVETTDENAERLIRDDVGCAVDVLRGPLFRHVVFRIGPRRHVWYLRVHHIVHDGQSLLLVQKRVAELYAGSAAEGFGSFSRVLDAQAAYARSAAWQRDAEHWRQTLDGVHEPVQTPPRERAVGSVALDGQWEPVVVAAVAVDQWRRTGLRDVVLNLPLTGRVGAAARNVPGMLVNVVPLRIRVAPGRTVDEVVGDVRSAMRKAQWHQRFPHPYRPRPYVTVLGDEHVVRFGDATATATLLCTGNPPDSPVVTAVRRGDRVSLDIVADGAARFTTLLAAVAGGGPARLEDVIQ
jgi:nonribosomal peptide synthetase DhbF